MSQSPLLRRLITLLSTVFFFSGFASLIYQVVWQRLLTLHYGVGSISTTLIVGVYMAGLGIGGWVGGLLAERTQRRVLLYFWIELGIGIFGLFSLVFVDFLGHATAGSPYILSAFYMFLFLSVPTFLMGITLPLLTKIFSRFSQNFVGTVSFLYFINTIGASVGALFTSYVLISFFGLDWAVYFAAVIDLVLAILIWYASRLANKISSSTGYGDATEMSRSEGLGRWAYLLIFVTGFLALGYEIVWYRLIGVLVKDSPYAFSTILSVYLLGVALGSLAINKYLAYHPASNRKSLFFFLQFLIGFYVLASLIAYYYLTRDTGFAILTKMSFDNYLHPDPELLRFLPKHIPSFKLIYSYLDIFLWPLFFLFIPTILMGAGFPLVSSLALSGREEGRTVGTVYFFNILGNVLGSVLTGFVILPVLGSETTLLALALTSILGLLFAVRVRNRPWELSHRVGILVLAISLSILFFPHRGEIYRLIHPAPTDSTQIIGEGVDAVVVSYYRAGPTSDYINGQEHGRFGTEWYYAWVTEAASFAPSLDNVLVIGFGSGTFPAVLEKTAGLGKMTVVELSPTLIENQKDIPFYQRMLSDPRMTLVIDDGRRYLLQSQEKFDVILMDPIRTTTSHANNLHSRQFFELARQHLKPGGIFLIGGLNEDRSVPKTIAVVFQNVRVYDLFTLASDSSLNKNEERQQNIYAALSERDRNLVSDYVNRNYRGDRNYILNLAAQYPINEEWKPNTEFYMGLRILERLHLLEHDPK